MKKIFAIFIIPYVILMGIIFYIYFGTGIFSNYHSIQWNQIDAMVPEGFTTQTYENKGWEVYYLRKLTVQAKIAIKSPAIDINNMAQKVNKLKFKTQTGETGIFYIANPHKAYEVVYAVNIDGKTLYFSVTSPSVYSATYILKKMTTNCSYNGNSIGKLNVEIPLKVYITDIIFSVGILIPVLLISIIFSLSGKKPAEKYFEGDPIRFEEINVYFTRIEKFRRKGSFCYLVLTVTRLMVFVFGKPVMEFKLDSEKPNIQFQGKKIVLQKDNNKVILKPSDIDQWKNQLITYM